jgi:hypothetical protein
MFEAARKHLRSIAMLAVAAALVVAGVAAAQGSSEAGTAAAKVTAAASVTAAAGPPPGPIMGMAMPGLTYAELHVQNKEGDEETIRLDQGKVKSVGSGSITLTENDGSEVTVKVDDDTQVIGKPGEETSLEDLESGQQVSVSGPDGGTAKAIMVMPKKGDFAARQRGPGQPARRRGDGCGRARSRRGRRPGPRHPRRGAAARLRALPPALPQRRLARQRRPRPGDRPRAERGDGRQRRSREPPRRRRPLHGDAACAELRGVHEALYHA